MRVILQWHCLLTFVLLPLRHNCWSKVSAMKNGVSEGCWQRELRAGTTVFCGRTTSRKTKQQKLQFESHGFKDDADFLLYLFDMNDNEQCQPSVSGRDN